MSSKLCQLTEIPENSGLAVDCEGPDGRRRIVIFRTNSGPKAYLDICPHQGRSFEFAPGEYLLDERDTLICPHHGASFELASGSCLSGPCQGDRLSRVEIKLIGSAVHLAETKAQGE